MKVHQYLAIFFLLVLFTQGAGLAQNLRMNGYKGIWFTLGQFSAYGDKYSGGLGTYTSSHIPIAIYSRERERTYFIYGGTTASDQKHLLIMMSYYDHKKGVVPKPVIVLDKQGVDDPHDNASISIDERGFVWVFVSGRNTSRPGMIFKSRKPHSIDNFEKIRQAEMTYPQPWWNKGRGFLYLFTKYTNGRELYWSTSSDGIVWEPDQKLAGMGGQYQVSNQWKDKVVTVFNYHPGGNVDKRTNIYLLQTSDMGKSWQTVEAKNVSAPLINKLNEALVKDFEKEGKLVYLNDLNFDREGNPVILCIVSKGFQPGPAGNPREWTIAHWKNNKWNFSKVCESTHNYDMGSLYVENGRWQVIGPTETGPQQYGTGGEMASWSSGDEGKTWKKESMLTVKSTRNHSYARRPMNAHEDFYAFWADGDADKLSESRLYFSNKKGTKVWMLPYDMDHDFQRPIEVKQNNR